MKCMGKEEKPEWEKVDLEKGLRKAGLKSLYPAEACDFTLLSLAVAHVLFFLFIRLGRQ